MFGTLLGGLPVGFEADPERLAPLEAIQQHQLVDQDRGEGVAPGRRSAAGGDRPHHVEDGFELAVEVLDRLRPQGVKHPPHVHPGVSVGGGAPLGRDEEPAIGGAPLGQCPVTVGRVAEQEAQFGRQFAQQRRGQFVVGDVGRGQLGREWDPDRRDGGDQVQFPAIDPAVPGGLAPVRLGVDRGVGHYAGRTLLLVPDAAAGPAQRAVDGRRPAAVGPWREQADELAAEAADLRRQGIRDGGQPAVPGSAAGEAAIDRQQLPELPHLRGVLGEDGEHAMGPGQVLDDHDDERFEEEAVRLDFRSAAPPRGRWREWEAINPLDESDETGRFGYHRDASAVRCGNSMVRGAAPALQPALCAPGDL